MSLGIPSPDVDFARGLNSLVAIQADQNFTGAAKTAMGAVAPNYQTVPGWEAVPCMIQGTSANDLDYEDRIGIRAVYLILFAGRVSLDRRHQLSVLDPVTRQPQSPPELLSVVGLADDEARMGHHTAVTAVRRT